MRSSETPDLSLFFKIGLDLFCVAGTDGLIKDLNPAWERTLGFSREQLLARPFLEFVHPDDVERVMAAFGAAMTGTKTEPLECRIRCADQSYRWLRWSSGYVLDRDLIYGMATDVTDLRTSEESRRESEASFGLLLEAVERNVDARRESDARFQAIFESAAVGIALADMEGSLLEVNPALGQLLRRRAGELRGHTLTKFARAEDSTDVRSLFEELVEGSRPSYRVERRFLRGDGSFVPTRETVSLVRDHQGKPTFVVAMVEDLTLGLVDELTGLHNRRAFMVFGQKELHLALREHRGPAVLFLDVDGMKGINDRFGHAEGDRALQAMAGILSRSLRAADLSARFGGDEFCVLLFDGGHLEAVIERLELGIASWNGGRARPYQLAVSIGASRFDWRAPVPIDGLIAEADRAMYRAKGSDSSTPGRGA